MSTAISSAKRPAPLPDPDDRPQCDVVIFDGHCRMCTAQIKQLRRLDRGGRLAYLSLHDPRVAERYPDLTHDALMEQMVVVDRQGMRHAGAAAVRHLSRRLPLLWWLAPALHLPSSLPVWQRLYRFVARNRYRFGRMDACDGGTCHLHGR